MKYTRYIDWYTVEMRNSHYNSSRRLGHGSTRRHFSIPRLSSIPNDCDSFLHTFIYSLTSMGTNLQSCTSSKLMDSIVMVGCKMSLDEKKCATILLGVTVFGRAGVSSHQNANRRRVLKGSFADIHVYTI